LKWVDFCDQPFFDASQILDIIAYLLYGGDRMKKKMMNPFVFQIPVAKIY
jgi:hypothetical protein